MDEDKVSGSLFVEDSTSLNKSEKRHRCAGVIGIISLIATIVAAVLIITNIWTWKMLYVLIATWAILPPSWFWYEYFYIYREYGKKGTLELYKYGQQVSGAVWAGVLVVLFAIASSDNLKVQGKEESIKIAHELLESLDKLDEKKINQIKKLLE